jgi:hypothetical protein
MFSRSTTIRHAVPEETHCAAAGDFTCTRGPPPERRPRGLEYPVAVFQFHTVRHAGCSLTFTRTAGYQQSTRCSVAVCSEPGRSIQTGLVVSSACVSLLFTINSECSGCAGLRLRRRNTLQKTSLAASDQVTQPPATEAVRACDDFRHRSVAGVLPSGIESPKRRECVQPA